MGTENLEKEIDEIVFILFKLKEKIKNTNLSKETKENDDDIKKNTLNENTSNENFESLKKALESDKWPEAVNKNLICDPNSERDKTERGRGVIELMVETSLNGLNFLDIGCGEGQIIAIATEYEPNYCVGYDCEKNNKWDELKKENSEYTDDWDTVISKGPYDAILLFDVLDHVKKENQVSLLKKAKEVLSDNGKIFIRFHPYVSKHGTHLYHHLNKAYAHLVFTKEEIKNLVPDTKYAEESDPIMMPLLTYEKFIKDAGLEIESRREITSKVDPFFKIPKIAERIMQNNNFDSFPEFQMSLDFVDFVLRKSN